MRRPGSSNSFLGLALGDRDCSVAEVAASKTGVLTLTRVGSFQLPAGATPEQPQAIADVLKHFLRSNNFATGKVVIGLPAKWLTSRERSIPPSNAATAAALLRVQAERAFPPELKDLVFDYAGESSTGESRNVLLLAASRQQVDRAAATARLAGLTPVAVTPSALALSSALAASSKSRTLLAISPDSAELVVRSETGPRVLRHLPVTGVLGSNGTPAPGLVSLGGELMRTLAVSGASADGPVALYDSLGLEPVAITTLSNRAGLSFNPARNLASLDVGGSPASDPEALRYAPAVALALAGLKPELLGADFLHTRLAPPKQRRLGRKAVWITAASVAAAVLIGYPIYDLSSTQAAIDAIDNDLAVKKHAIDTAEANAAKLKIANGWYATKPPVLEAMKHIAQAFPQEGTIWATNFTMRETGKGTLSGKANDRLAVIKVRDFLMNDKRFSDVQLTETHEGGGTGGSGSASGGSSRDRETSFSISFTFKEGT